jgi:hypothetical protein
MGRRYAKASKTEKGLMLDELCALTGWTRRHARRCLVRVVAAPPAPQRRPRPKTYGPEVLGPLKIVWATLNGPAGRLGPLMAEAVEALERHGELALDEQVRAKLLRISSARSTGPSRPSEPA